MTSAIHFISGFAGEMSSSACGDNVELALSTCCFLGVQWLQISIITFLGIEVDINTLQLCLPVSKVSELLQTVKKWMLKCLRAKHQLLSLIGCLHNVASVVKSGCTFFAKYYKGLNCSVKTLFTSLLIYIPLGVLAHECTA